MINDFKKFILRGNVVDLAVGIVIGSAFTTVVNALVKDMISPLIAVIYGTRNFSSASFTIHGSHFLYGDLINAFISFMIVALVIFFFVVQPINKLSEFSFRSKTTPESTTHKCPYCLATIPKEASRCRYCTSKLEPEKGSK